MIISNYWSHFEYYMVIKFYSFHRVFTIENTNEVLTSVESNSGIRIIYENEGKRVYVSSPNKDSVDYLLERARDIIPYSGNNRMVKREKIISLNQSNIEINENEIKELLKMIYYKLKLENLPNPKVKLRISESQREHYDTLESNIYESSYDAILTLSILDKNKRRSEQFNLFSGNLQENIEAFIIRMKIIINCKSVSRDLCELPIILGPLSSSGFVHELFGHLCEADIWWLNKNVDMNLSEELNIYDDPLNASDRSRYYYDEEGIKAEQVNLVNKGEFTSLLHSLETSNLYNENPNGHGRSNKHDITPIPRQSKLVVAPCEGDSLSFIRSLNKGFYINSHVNGRFTGERIILNANFGYYIQAGKIVTVEKDINLDLNVIKALNSIKQVGADIQEITTYACNKYDERVAVDFLVPSLLIVP